MTFATCCWKCGKGTLSNSKSIRKNNGCDTIFFCNGCAIEVFEIDVTVLAYQSNTGRKVSLKLEGFGFKGNPDEMMKHPQYKEFHRLFKELEVKLNKIMEAEE